MALPVLLILDDDPAVGRLLQRMAVATGLQATYVSEPSEFFVLLDETEPDFIALDLVMPGMDGVEVVARLAERGCRARILLTSGVGSRVLEAAERSASEQGLDVAGVLPKPYSVEAFRRLVLTREPALRPGTGREPVLDPGREHEPAPGSVFTPDSADLRSALDRGEIEVVYQPKVRCADGSLAGLEALARWRHPEGGMISPDMFVRIAETSSLIGPLTRHVLDAALAWFGAWTLRRETGSGGREKERLSLAVNLSPGVLRDETLVGRLLEQCRRSSVAPERLVLELTETAAMEDPVASLSLLTRIRVKGFQLSIDDFGTGYSSMLQLVRLPFSEMKVDRSFVSTARDSAESRSVIRSIADLGHALGLRVTAEGVEDAGTLAYVREAGCDEAQGYYIGRPMPGERLEEWVRGRNG